MKVSKLDFRLSALDFGFWIFKLDMLNLYPENTFDLKYPLKGYLLGFLGQILRPLFPDNLCVGKEKTQEFTTFGYSQIFHVFSQYWLFNLIKQYNIQTAELKWVVLKPPSTEVGVSPSSCAFYKELFVQCFVGHC